MQKIHLVFADFIPLIIGAALSAILGIKVWWGFFFVFAWIGASITAGNIIGKNRPKQSLGRKISLLLILPVFIVFFGLFQRENMQLEETVFYTAFFLSAGVFTRVLIHFVIAKVAGPLIWGRGFCGWACWTAAVLEWLPIKENRKIPKSLTWVRVPVLIVSILIPFLAIQMGYNYMQGHIRGDSGALLQTAKFDQFLWFLAGNGIYYASGIILAFVFKKKRAFCKIACPVSLIMKAQTKIALVHLGPTSNSCTQCGACSRVCPMDVDVMGYIRAKKKINSSECILCGQCAGVCPAKAIG